jgi:chemotaxis protein CheD
MDDPIVVRIAEFHAGRGEGRMKTFALGSCLAIVLYEPANRVGALSHTMLPQAQNTPSSEAGTRTPAKYVDSAIPAMVQEICKLGASPSKVVSKLVGGARMFPGIASSEVVNIGERNVARARQVLAAMKISIVAEDTGGTHGRSVLFDLSDGSLLVSSLKAGERTL